jgi:TetR/AcrR family transcriptional regulator, cholesterol catabolism regulator
MEDQKAKILHASEQLFMRYGLKSVSMDDVAKHLGISKKTIYNFLKDKKDLVFQVLQCHFSKNENECKAIFAKNENPVNQMLFIGQHIVSNYQSLNPSFINDLRKYFPKGWQLFNEYKNNIIRHYIVTNLINGVEQGYYRNDINIEVIADLYLNLTEIITQSRNLDETKNRFPLIVTEMINYHLHGVCSAKGIAFLNEKKRIQ